MRNKLMSLILGTFQKIHQIPKLKTSPSFPAIRLYVLTIAGLARGFPKPGRLGGSPGRPGGGMGGC